MANRLVVSLVALAYGLASSYAGPAPTPANFSQTTAGAIASTVPDGVCGVTISSTGGGGASSGVATGASGAGGMGAAIGGTFRVLPLQVVTGAVAGAGVVSNVNGGTSTGGPGTAAGGNGGLIPATGVSATWHRGGGGGGSSSISIGGVKILEAGGGGGGGAAHQNAGAGGNAGSTGIAAGVAAGVNGAVGDQITASFAGATSAQPVNGGQGGQTAAGGAGGVNNALVSENGFAGAGIGTGTGGNGGIDTTIDSGGGGGGGYTGGGGGASTIDSSQSGGGGGGGASFVRLTSPTVTATATSAITGTVATVGNPGAGGAGNTATNGTAGQAALNWVLCNYTLSIAKSASPTTVNAGAKTVWTVTVTNTGPDPMTRGDTISLTDTLPTPVSGTAPAYKVLSVSSAGGTNTDMAGGAVTCTGVAVGSTMPASTVCSRPYDASGAPGAPIGGTRGLNAGETLTITYEQIFPNTAACQTVTNAVSTADRAATRNATAPVTLQCYDLAITKTASPATASVGVPTTWTINVTNNGPADMMGPNDTTTNGLTVTDAAPAANVTAPAAFNSTGPLASCTYTSPTISCPTGLASGQTQSFTFQQTLNSGVAVGTTISNTASIADPKTGDANDSATASVSVPQPTIQITKTTVGGGGPFTFNGTNGFGTDTITTPAAGGTTVGVTKNLTTVGTATTVTETIPSGWSAALTSCTGTPAANYSFNAATGALAFTAAATSSGNQLKCTITNTKLPTIQLTKISNGAVGTFNFSGDNGFGSDAVITATSGTGVNGVVKTLTAAAAATTTITEAIPAGYVVTAISCSGLGSGGTATPTLGTGKIVLDIAATAAGSNITCTFTNTKTPTVKLQKLTRGKSGGPFSFTQTGLASTPAPITTVTLAAEPAAPTPINATIGTGVTLNETVDPNFVTAGVTCSDANSAITLNSVPITSATATVSIPPGNIKAGADYTCLFTNDRIATVKVQKTTLGGFGGPFAFTTTNLATTPANITTAAASTPTPAAPTANNVSTLGSAVTINEPAIGGFFLSSATCTDANSAVTNNTGLFTTLTGTTLTIPLGNVKAGADFTCVFSNTMGAPNLKVAKSASPLGPFSVGQTVTYTYKVTNTGNVPVANVTVSDTHNGTGVFAGPNNETLVLPTGGFSSDTTANNGIWTLLGVGDTVSFTATYVVTQHDVDFL